MTDTPHAEPVESAFGSSVLLVDDLAERPTMDSGAPGQPQDDSAATLTQIHHRYHILSTLGRGGMGTVYLAEDHDLNRQVALKVINLRAEQARPTFLKEAQILGQLEHPNIVPLYDIGFLSDGRLYCTMRRVRGRTLRDVITPMSAGDADTTRKYSLTRLMQIALQLLQAVGYAHDHGIIHLDLKPANVMLGEHGEVQVLDWGLAQLVRGAGSVTQTAPFGTPGHMAPEQIRHEPLDHRADIFALGTILYELLVLRPAFDGKTTADVLEHVMTADPPRPRVVAADRQIPLALEAACVHALQKAADDRPQSARELADAVQLWLEAETDKTKRHQLAEEKAAEGRSRLDAYCQMKSALVELDTAATAAATTAAKGSVSQGRAAVSRSPQRTVPTPRARGRPMMLVSWSPRSTRRWRSRRTTRRRAKCSATTIGSASSRPSCHKTATSRTSTRHSSRATTTASMRASSAATGV